MTCPLSQMDLNGFLMALGDFPVDLVGASVDALVDFGKDLRG